jgi:hypothetical protein
VTLRRLLLLSLLAPACAQATVAHQVTVPNVRGLVPLSARFAVPGCYAAPLNDDGRHLPYSGPSSTVSGQACQANFLNVTAAGAFVRARLPAPWPSSVTHTAPFCISARATRADWTPATYGALWSAGPNTATAGGANELAFGCDATRCFVQWRKSTGAAVEFTFAADAWADGSEHRITICADPSTGAHRRRVDGVTSASWNPSSGTIGAWGAAPARLNIGAFNSGDATNGSFPWEGSIRDFKVCRTFDPVVCENAAVASGGPPVAFDQPVAASAFRVSSPDPDAVVSGVVSLAASNVPPGTANLEFELNDRIVYERGDAMAPLTAAPWEKSWDTWNVIDGPRRAVAVARDASGRVLARSAPVTFTVENGIPVINPAILSNANRAELVLEYPKQLGHPLTGTVSIILTWTATWTPAGANPWNASCAVDGVPITTGETPYRALITLDTTTLRNGEHQLSCYLNAVSSSPSYQHPVATLFRRFRTENGAAAMELRATAKEVHLDPVAVGTAQVGVVLVNTDGSTSAATDPAFASTSTAIATVDPSGVVSAVAPGSTTVWVTSGGRTAKVWVHVHSEPGVFAHFSKTGEIRTTYSASDSRLMRSMFMMSGPALTGYGGEPAMTPYIPDSALNTTEGQLWQPPVPASSSFDSWKPYADTRISDLFTAPTAAGMSVYLQGDDLARDCSALAAVLNNPAQTEMVQYAMKEAKARGALAIDLVDEVSMLWGPTPTPTTAWTNACSTPADAWVNFRKMIRGEAPYDAGSGHPYAGQGNPWLAFSALGIAPGSTKKAWAEFGDINGQYWDATTVVYPDTGASTYETLIAGMDRYITGAGDAGALSVWMPDKPSVVLVSAAGPYYTKGPDSTGSRYDPHTDWIESGRQVPINHVSATALHAALRGAAGIRYYAFDHDAADWEREFAAKNWTQWVQTFASPHHVGGGQSRWEAMSAANRTLAALEAALLQPQAAAPDLGAMFATGARAGANGTLLVVLNISEVPETLTVPLAAHSTGKSTGTRYRVVGRWASNEAVGAIASETVTMEPGEAIAWWFQ